MENTAQIEEFQQAAKIVKTWKQNEQHMLSLGRSGAGVL